MPGTYPNAQEIAGAVIGARAFTDGKEAKENFGFDIISAGMLPVERDDLLQAVVEGISEQIASNIDPWVRAGLCQAVPA